MWLTRDFASGHPCLRRHPPLRENAAGDMCRAGRGYGPPSPQQSRDKQRDRQRGQEPRGRARERGRRALVGGAEASKKEVSLSFRVPVHATPTLGPLPRDGEGRAGGTSEERGGQTLGANEKVVEVAVADAKEIRHHAVRRCPARIAKACVRALMPYQERVAPLSSPHPLPLSRAPDEAAMASGAPVATVPT